MDTQPERGTPPPVEVGQPSVSPAPVVQPESPAGAIPPSVSTGQPPEIPAKTPTAGSEPEQESESESESRGQAAAQQPEVGLLPQTESVSPLLKMVEKMPGYEAYSEVVAAAQKISDADPANTALKEALETHKLVRELIRASSNRFNPLNGKIFDEQGKEKPNYQLHVKTIIEAVRAAGTGGEALKQLEPHLIDSQEGEGYYYLEARQDYEIINRSAVASLAQIRDSLEATRKQNPENIELYRQTVLALAAIITPEGKLPLDTGVSIQLLHEVLSQLPAEFDNISFRDRPITDASGNTKLGVYHNLGQFKVEVGVKYKELTNLGQKNLVADYLISEMKNVPGMTFADKPIAGNEPEVLKELVGGEGKTGLQLLTELEGAAYNRYLKNNEAMHKMLGKLGINIGGVTVSDNPVLTTLASNETLLKNITTKIFGGKGILNSEILGEKLARQVGRGDRKKIDPQLFFIIMMVAAPTMLSMMSEEEGGQQAAA